MAEKWYRFLGMTLRDGDTFEAQEEPVGANPHNPSGIAIHTFNHKNWHGVEELPAQSNDGTPALEI